METNKKLRTYALLLISVIFLFASCQRDDDIKEDPPPPNNPVDANKITKSIKFRNAKIISGNIPTALKKKNAASVDLKIDTDTIFWVEGAINRIKILKPNSGPLVGSFFAQVEGSDLYIEAEFEKEEETDTIVFLNFDFDITDWDPPLSFNIKIFPKDDTTGEPLDTFEKPVEIQKKYNGGSCDIELNKTVWDWMSTWVGGSYSNGPLVVSIQDGEVTGCCSDSGVSYTGGGCNPDGPDARTLQYSNNYMINFDFFQFPIPSAEKFIFGRLKEDANNIDITETDFCSNEVSYISNMQTNNFRADYILNVDNCSFTLENMKGDNIDVNGVPFPLPIYMGSGPNVEYEILSNHFIKEVRKSPEGNPNGDIIRFYIRRNSDKDGNYIAGLWHD